MQYPFLDRYPDGTFARASKSIWSLTVAWNCATNPALPMTDHEHHRSRQYARAIKGRMARLGYTHGKDYIELSNGMLWPKRRQYLINPSYHSAMSGTATKRVYHSIANQPNMPLCDILANESIK